MSQKKMKEMMNLFKNQNQKLIASHLSLSLIQMNHEKNKFMSKFQMKLKSQMASSDGVSFVDQLLTIIVKIDIQFAVLNASNDSLTLLTPSNLKVRKICQNFLIMIKSRDISPMPLFCLNQSAKILIRLMLQIQVVTP